MRAVVTLTLLVEVTDGMTADRVREWADYLRHDLEKTTMAGDDDRFDVLRAHVTAVEGDHFHAKQVGSEPTAAYTAGKRTQP